MTQILLHSVTFYKKIFLILNEDRKDGRSLVAKVNVGANRLSVSFCISHGFFAQFPLEFLLPRLFSSLFTIWWVDFECSNSHGKTG